MALRDGVSPALLRIAAVNLGVASLPCIARMATAFLKSSGGEASSFFGVVVNLGFFALGGFARALPGDFLLIGDAGLSGVAYLAGVTCLPLGDFGLAFAGDLLLGLLAGDFDAFGLFAGDDPALGVLAGDLGAFGLFAGDSAFTGVSVTIDGDFLGLFPGDLLLLALPSDLPLGLLPGDFLGVVFLGLFAAGDFAFLGLSSKMASELSTAIECLLIRPFSGEPADGADFLLGVAPRLSGVDAGSFLSNNSGLNLGPNETLFLFDAGSVVPSTDFLFCPGFGDLPSK